MSEEATKIALEIADDIEKEVDGAIDIFNNGVKSVVKRSIPTGIYNLDQILSKDLNGVWGLPEGRIVEIFGEESTSKTTLYLTAIKSARKRGGYGLVFDDECALDPEYAKKLGIDRMTILQPECLEDMLKKLDDSLEIAKKFRANGFDKPIIFAVDSVAATPTKEEIDEGFELEGYGTGAARTWSRAMRQIPNKVAEARVSLILINQKRQKIGAMAFATQYETYGGKAIRFYSSIRIELKRVGGEKDGKGEDTVHTADIIEAHSVKNKLAVPRRKVRFAVKFGVGINTVLTLLDALEMRGVVSKGAAGFYTYKEEKFRRNEFSGLLTANKDLKKDLLEQLKG